jgi:hypothetical protein
MWRMVRVAREREPELLRPCPDTQIQLRYGRQHDLDSIRRTLSHLEAGDSQPAFGVTSADVEQLLLRGYGCLLADALRSAGPGQSAKTALGDVKRYKSIPCTILETGERAHRHLPYVLGDGVSQNRTFRWGRWNNPLRFPVLASEKCVEPRLDDLRVRPADQGTTRAVVTCLRICRKRVGSSYSKRPL